MTDPTRMSREELEAFVRVETQDRPSKPPPDVELEDEVSSATLERVYKDRSKRVGSTATKAWAAGGGGGLGAALAQVLVLLLPRLEPAEVALSIILSSVIGFAAAYLAPANKLTS